MKPPQKVAAKRAPRPVFAADYQVMVQHLRAATRASSFSQLELAERLGKTPAYLSKVLNGHQVITLIEVRAICNAANIPFVEWIAELDASLKK